MGYGNKIGKEYYVEKESLLQFLEKFKGKEIAFKDETHISAISAEAPTQLSVGGLWFQVL